VQRIEVTEGVPFTEPHFADLIRQAADRLTSQLRPRVRLFHEEAGAFTIRNVVGGIRLDDTTMLEVAPKVDATEDWVRAVLDLLVGHDRIDIGGERLAGIAPRRPELLDVLASAYATRLQRALRRDGPLVVIERRRDRVRVYKGKLQATAYLRDASWRPHVFPTSFDVLSADNEYSRAMALVARMLASAASSFAVSASLLQSAAALRPGYEEEVRVDPTVVSRPFPEQWGVYRPAWSIVIAVLSRTSLLAASGQHRGVEVAIEVWPLLERLLERSLDDATRAAQSAGRSLARVPKAPTSLLVAPSEGGKPRGVEPDGWLVENGRTVATFEAKYSARLSRWPDDAHVFQALTTAAACDSPLAVLVYPESFAPVWWDVEGFHGTPANLVAVGLGLFSYRRASGDRKRGELILDLIAGRPSTTSMSLPSP
jgi:hypothetical protein